MHAVSISNFTKRYKGGTLAVDNLSLSIEKGDFFGLLGPNGAGKSTTIHCLTGIAMPTSGTLSVMGVDVVKDYREARKKIGLSPQEFNFEFFGVIEETLRFIAGYYGIPRKAAHTRVLALLERFNLLEHRHKPFRELSGGLKRRVMLARALLHDPDVLIFDEPTAGVDVELRHELWKYLKELNEVQGKTIILTSHYLEEVEHLTKTIAIINHGTIVAEGKKEEFMKNGDRLETAYLKITKGEGW